MELIELCLSFYILAVDAWDTIKSHPSYMFDDGTITIKEKGKYFFAVAFGRLVIASGDAMKWKFKIVDVSWI